MKLTCKRCHKDFKIDFKVEPVPNKSNIKGMTIDHQCPHCRQDATLIIDFTPLNKDSTTQPSIKIVLNDQNYIG